MDLTPNTKTDVIRFLVANLVCFLLVFGAVAIGVVTLDTYAGLFTKDIASIGELIPIAGAVSQLGIILWSVSLSVTGFGALIVSEKSEKEFLYSLSILSLILMFDDTFQVHEKILPGLFGINEIFLFAFEGGILVFILLRFSRLIAQSKYLLLVIAILWFSLSLIVDIFLAERVFPRWHHLLEDGPKFLGIMNWTTYCGLVSHSLVGNKARSDSGTRFVG
jgi:hypothetical protein